MKKNRIKVPFSKPSISKAEEKEVLKVMRSGWLTTGKCTLKFEKEFSDFMNFINPSISDEQKKEIFQNRKNLSLSNDDVKSLAVNSNTSGMILAMEACGVKKGNAIITTPYTFVSTATCARHLGAEVIFADIEKDSYSISPQKIEEILKNDSEKKIKAVVPVHIAGNVCNMKKICEIAKKYSVKVIEDAAHSFPSLTEEGYAGTIGDVGVFSFYATKTITTAEGGMVCTRDENLLKRMETMRLHGMDRTTWDRYTSDKASWEYDIIAPGYKFNLPDILSAIGCVQLKKANILLEKRKKIFQKYNEAFKNLDFISLPPDSKGNAMHLYLLNLNLEKLKISRNDFGKHLQDSGIGISMHFIPLFNFTYWKNLYPDFTPENFPEADKKGKQTLSLPLWPSMTEKMIDAVIQAVKETGEKFHV